MPSSLTVHSVARSGTRLSSASSVYRPLIVAPISSIEKPSSALIGSIDSGATSFARFTTTSPSESPPAAVPEAVDAGAPPQAVSVTTAMQSARTSAHNFVAFFMVLPFFSLLILSGCAGGHAPAMKAGPPVPPRQIPGWKTHGDTRSIMC